MQKYEDVKGRGIPTQADQWVNWQVTVTELENQIKSTLKKFCHSSTYFSSPMHFFPKFSKNFFYNLGQRFSKLWPSGQIQPVSFLSHILF